MTTSLPEASLLDHRKTPHERRIGRHYLRELGAALVLYTVLLFGANAVERSGHAETEPLQTAVALLPMLGVVAAAWAILRMLFRLDEYQRRIQFHALAIAFAGTAVLSLGYGFLEGIGSPRISMFWVWPVMGALWLVALTIFTLRDRVGSSDREVPPR